MENIRVAAVSIRNDIGLKDGAIENMGKWAARAKDRGAEVVLFPELNVSGYVPADVAAELAETVPGPSSERIVRLARDQGVTIAFGIIERERENLFCTHVLVNPKGILGKQRKIHVPAHERPYWRAGHSIDVFDVGKARVGMAICRDSFFGEMTRTLYFKGAEIVLMPFGYYNVPRSEYLAGTIHGMSLIKASWSNGFYSVLCNSALGREPSEWEPRGRKFPGWAGVISPWGRVISFVDDEGNDEAMVLEELDAAELEDRRSHPNFLARELRPDLYDFGGPGPS